MGSLQQIAAVVTMNLYSLPQRVGASLVIVIGIAGVVGVLICILAMAVGFARTVAGTGRPDRVIVLSNGAISESLSSIPREAALNIINGPGIRKDAAGRPIAAAEVLAQIQRPRKGGVKPINVTLRGVGATEGQHDEGRGELDDLMHLIERVPWLPDAASPVPIALAGFSFGSFVAAHAAAQLQTRRAAARHLILVGAAAGKWPMPPVDPGALVIHGEQDETILLTDVLAWAGTCDVPVVVIPGADHFFHRRLPLLKRLATRHLLGAEAESARSGAI